MLSAQAFYDKLPLEKHIEMEAQNMDYDFTTPINRANTGSYKWDQMKEWNPTMDENIYPLSVADVDMKTAPEIVQGLKEYLETAVLGYDAPTKEYLQAVTGWMKNKHRWDIQKEWIIPIPGVVTALYSAVRAYTEPGEGVLILSPVYYPFYSAISHSNRNIVSSSLLRKGNHYEIDFNDFEAKVKDPTNKLLLFCNPHNPVGRVWTRAELQKLADLCLANDVLILSDEIHQDIIMPGHTHIPMASLSKAAADITITATATSKSFNLAGLKNSNVIISSEKLKQLFMDDLKTVGIEGGSNVIGLKATELAYTKGEPWLKEFKELIWKNHQELKRYLNRELPEVTVFDLEGTFLQWLDFNAFDLSAKELERILHKEALVFGDEGYIFGVEGNGYERLNIAVPTKVLMEALERLVTAMDRYR